MSDVRVFIGLGGNLGNPKESFGKAMRLLSESGSTVVEKSKLYRTKPYGYSDQPDFLNAAIEIRTSESPMDLLQTLQQIETKLGKKVVRENGPRLIDLDLLFYGDSEMQKDQLELPHPGITSRDFVLLPLCDIAPDWVHPSTGLTLKKHSDALSETYASGEKETW